jgi:colicin import membrane protein
MRHLPKKEAGLGSSLACSLLFHGLLLALVLFMGTFQTFHAPQAPVYYVDLLNLPVADPRAGSPAARGAEAAAPSAPEQEALPLPATAPTAVPKTIPKPITAAKQVQPESDKEFQERLARLQRNVEGRHAAAAIDNLRQKVASGAGRAGMPGGTGTEAGSDYGSYIQSRLRDAFAQTIAARSTNPQVVVRLTIDRFGKLIGYRLEKSSGDTVFEEAVTRAVRRAEATFPPPPGGKQFQQGFIFKPEGVGTK